METKTGTINWYDSYSEKGCIIGDDGSFYRIHEFIKVRGELEHGTRVAFTLCLSSIHPILSSLEKIC